MGQMLLDGLKAMVLGMGMVYVFLILMIFCMKLMSKILEPYKNALVKAAPAAKKPAAAKKSGGLSEQDIQRMVDDAKAHEAEDKLAKEKIEVKNRADNMVYQTEKQLNELGDKVPESLKAPVTAGIEQLKKDIERDDTEAMKATMKDLEEKLMAIGQEVYKAQQAAQQQGGAPGAEAPKGGDDDVIDAEVVNDDK